MTYSFVLVHSPLIGPYSWRPVAAELERQGHRAVTPSLLPALDSSLGFSHAFAQLVREAVNRSEKSGPLILVGHSAAGAYLPVIAAELDREVCAYVFVDARLPERHATLADQDAPQDEDLRRELAQDGMLPPWSDWFGDDVLAEVIPDGEQRRRFVAELRPVPLALFHEKITYPPEWPGAPCAYICMSQFYRPLAQEASARGWPVMEIDAGHLHTLTHPGQVAPLILEILDQMEIP